MLRQLDADLHSAFAGADMADGEAIYLGPDQGDVAVDPVRGYFDELQLDTVGQAASSVSTRREVAILRADVETPKKGGLITIDSVQWKLSDKVSEDHSLSRWVVRRV